MNKLIKKSVGIAACVALASLAYSIVIINEDGTGFIGKGDVQLACGFNNKAMQDAVKNGVTFFDIELSTVEQDCQANTNPEHGQPIWTVVGQRIRTRQYHATLIPDARNNSKGKDGPNTGFYLTGFTGIVNDSTDWGTAGTPTGCPVGSTPVGAPRAGEGISGLFTDCGDGRDPLAALVM